jgi:hypothetical protein
MLTDFGKYQNKSKGIPLQLFDQKSIFPFTITMIEKVIKFLSNYILTNALRSDRIVPV